MEVEGIVGARANSRINALTKQEIHEYSSIISTRVKDDEAIRMYII